MAILRFRIYWEEDDSVYRDVLVRHTHTFGDLHQAILKSYAFDNKHQATFFRSNDTWMRGREISIEKYDDRLYKVDPLLMDDTVIASEIKDPNQKFVYEYDFTRHWTFMVELINVDKSEDKSRDYPSCIRTEGIAPPQYGAKGLADKSLADIEEKYDLNAEAMMNGYGEEGEEGDDDGNSDDDIVDDGGNEEY